MSWDNVKPPPTGMLPTPDWQIAKDNTDNIDWDEVHKNNQSVPLLAPTDGWGVPSTVTQPVNTQSPPAPDAWGVPPIVQNWPAHPDQTSSMTVSYEEWAEDENNYPPATATTVEHTYAEIRRDSREVVWAKEIPPGTTITSEMVNDWKDEYSSITEENFAYGVERGKELNEALWTANALDSAVTKAGVVNSLAGTKDEFNVDQDGELTRMKEIVSSTQLGPHTYYIAYHNGRWLHAILSGPYDTKDRAIERFDEAYDKMINDVAFKLAFENTFNRAGIYCAQIPLSAKRKGAYGVLA